MPRHDVGVYYDEISSEYDRARFTHRYHQNISEQEERFVASRLGSRIGRVLEVGPGTGRFTRHLATLADDLWLCDISQEMLDRARERVGNHRSAHFVCEDIESLANLPCAGKLDAVVAMRVLSHVPDWQAALRSLCQVVRPGGVVIFDLWNRFSYVGLIRAIFRRPTEVLTHRLAPGEIQATLRQLPIDVLESFRWGYPRLGTFSLDRLGARVLPSLAYSTVFCCQTIDPNIAVAA
jgi:SAM-dependent methyltransferase